MSNKKISVNFFGDKSISHRALMLASICNGKSILTNLSNGEDVKSTIQCLQMCGIDIEYSNDKVIINGGKIKNPKKKLDCGNSGTTIRLMLGLLSGKNISAEFFGDKSLINRPMSRVTIPLGVMGADIKSNNGFLPIKIISNHLYGIDYTQKVASAQVKSAILLAGIGADGTTTVRENILSRNHTELMMKHIGINIDIGDDYCSVKRNDHFLEPIKLNIPGDPSTASFFAVAALLLKKRIILKNILGNPTRVGFFSILKEIGVKVKWLKKEIHYGEIIGDLSIDGKAILGIDIDKKYIPSIIDELPILAILATQINGRTRVSNAEELRFKETDRIRAICYNLKNMGANIIELKDGFEIFGPTKLKGVNIKTFGDHRIAMAFSISDLVSEGFNKIDNKECIKISCPDFFDLLKDILN